MTKNKHNYNWDAMEFDPDKDVYEAFRWYKTPQGGGWWQNNAHTCAGESAFARMKRLYAEDMAADTGTLSDLNVKPGDQLVFVEEGENEIGYIYPRGRIVEVEENGTVCECSPKYCDATWRVVSRVSDGPVRTVTKKEIVPGVYGAVTVENRVGGCRLAFPRDNFFCAENADELTAAIETLTQIRDALKENE